MFITSLFIALATAISSIAATAEAFTSLASPSSTKYNRDIAASLAPTPWDFADAPSLLLVKIHIMDVLPSKNSNLPMTNTDTELAAHVLIDASQLLTEFLPIFKSTKQHSKLPLQYMNELGRVFYLGVGLLPHHGYYPEEWCAQLFLLCINMKTIIRSIKLLKCISRARCAEECIIELDELDESLPK
eukprot:jgi/Psemu1/49100/gm1.49100_g